MLLVKPKLKIGKALLLIDRWSAPYYFNRLLIAAPTWWRE